MPNVPAIAASRIDAPRVPSAAAATITTTTGTIRTGVRTRVQD